MSFNWTQMIPGVGHEYAHVATLGIATAGVFAIGLSARAALGKGEVAILPASKFSLRGIMEMLVEIMSGLAEMVIGEHGKKLYSFFHLGFLLRSFEQLDRDDSWYDSCD